MRLKPNQFIVSISILLFSTVVNASTIDIFMKKITLPEECVLKASADFSKEQRISFVCNELTNSVYRINITAQHKDKPSSEELTDEERREQIRMRIASLREQIRDGVALKFSHSKLPVGDSGRFLTINSACDEAEGLCLELAGAPEQIVNELFSELDKAYSEVGH